MKIKWTKTGNVYTSYPYTIEEKKHPFDLENPTLYIISIHGVEIHSNRLTLAESKHLCKKVETCFKSDFKAFREYILQARGMDKAIAAIMQLNG